MLIISKPWALFESGFLMLWRMSFLEKWQLANDASVSKICCDGIEIWAIVNKSPVGYTETKEKW